MKILGILAVVVFAQVVRATEEQCWKKLDIGFMVAMKKCLGKDVDDDVTKPLLKKYIDSIKDAAGEDEDLRMAIFSYGKSLATHHAFTDDQARAKLLESAKNYEFAAGDMGLDDALQQCEKDKCFPSHDEKEVTKVLIVFTDGTEDAKDVAEAVEPFTSRGFHFVAVNINDLSAFAKLKGVLSDETKCSNIDDIVNKIKAKCKDEGANAKTTEAATPPTEPPKTKNADISFVIDSSYSLTDPQWKEEIQFAKDVVQGLVLTGTTSQFSGLAFDYKTYKGFDWTDIMTEAHTKLDGFKHNGGGATFTHLGIEDAMASFEDDSYKAKDGRTRKFIVVITDGAPSSVYKLQEQAEKANEENFITLAATVGAMTVNGKPSDRVLDIVNGDASRLFTTQQSLQMVNKIRELIA